MTILFYLEETLEDIENYIEYKHRGELRRIIPLKKGLLHVDTLNGSLYYTIVEDAGVKQTLHQMKPLPCYRWLVTNELQEAQAYWKGWKDGKEQP